MSFQLSTKKFKRNYQKPRYIVEQHPENLSKLRVPNSCWLDEMKLDKEIRSLYYWYLKAIDLSIRR